MSRVAVFGGSGFVGSAVVRHLRDRGAVVSVLPAPRLRSAAGTPTELLAEAVRPATGVARDLGGYDAVVNAAGVAQAPSDDRDLLVGANALLPAVVAQAAREAGVPRFVHLSSAAVQGRAPRLDEQPTHAADSEYSRSKALGEAALRATGWPGCVVLRPTSVHGPDRRVTQRLAALARSRLSLVEAPGTRHTPQVHVHSVARAVGVLVDPAEVPPPIVLQPSEGFTVAAFLTVMGCGRVPRHVPPWLAGTAISGAYVLARAGGSPVWAQARRAEMLLRGQEQVPGWLASRTDVVVPASAWEDLAEECRARAGAPA